MGGGREEKARKRLEEWARPFRARALIPSSYTLAQHQAAAPIDPYDVDAAMALSLAGETEQMMMAQSQGQGEQPMDQATAYLQAEQLKAQAKAQTDMAKLQIDAQKAIARDDRERDQMDQDLLVKAAEIYGKYQTSVDVAGVKQAQAAPRYPQDTPVQAVTGGRF